MKNFFKGLVEWKVRICIIYTAAMVFYLFFSTVFGGKDISVAKLWTLLLVCVAGSLLQTLCFSNLAFKKMRYTRRGLLFVALFLPALSLAAWKMEWFPAEQIGNWILFVGIFFLIFAIITVGFDIYFRISGRKYDGLIGQYRKSKEQEERES